MSRACMLVTQRPPTHRSATRSRRIRGVLSMTEPGQLCDLMLSINGHEHRVAAPACASLLDVLRDTLRLTGTKKGCDMGSCGACTVLVDGRRINACLALAVMQEGR